MAKDRDGKSEDEAVACGNCGQPIVYAEGNRSQAGEWAWRHRDGARTRSGSMRMDCYPGMEPSEGESYVQASPAGES